MPDTLELQKNVKAAPAAFLRSGCGGRDMSTATLPTAEVVFSYPHLVQRTVEACALARDAAAAAAEGIATGSAALLSSLREREKQLDKLDMEIDAGVTQAITHVSESKAR